MFVIAIAMTAGLRAQTPSGRLADPAYLTGTLENGITYYVRSNRLPPGQAYFELIQKPAGERLLELTLSRDMISDVERTGIHALSSRLKTASVLSPQTYRPHLMAVVAVGDIQADTVKQLIHLFLSQLPTSREAIRKGIRYPSELPPSGVMPLPLRPAPPTVGVELQYVIPRLSRSQRGSGVYYTMDFLDKMAQGLFQERLDRYYLEDTLAPCLRPVLTVDTCWMVRAFASPQNAGKTLVWLQSLTESIRKYGFTEEEFLKGRQDYLSGLRKIYRRRGAQTNHWYVRQCERHFIYGTGLASIEQQHAFVQEVLPFVGPAQLNQFATGILSYAPVRPRLEAPYTRADSLSYIPRDTYEGLRIQRDSLRLVADSIWTAEVERFAFVTDSVALEKALSNKEILRVGMQLEALEMRFMADSLERAARLLPPEDSLPGLLAKGRAAARPISWKFVSDPVLPEPSGDSGKIVQEGYDAVARAKVWALSNGAKVYLQRDTLLKGEVLFAAVPLEEREFPDMRSRLLFHLSGPWARHCGIGSLSASDLMALDTKVPLQWHTNLLKQDAFRGLKGSAPSEKTGLLLRRLYGFFTAPRDNPARFAAFLRPYAESAAETARLSHYVLADSLYAVLDGSAGSPPVLFSRAVTSLSEADFTAFRRACFSDAARWRFVFVGDFAEDSLRVQAQKYIATLPAEGIRPHTQDTRAFMPRFGVFRDSIPYPNLAGESKHVRVYTGSCPYTREQSLMLLLLEAYLKVQLGGGTEVETGLISHPQGHYFLYLGQRCAGRNYQDVKSLWDSQIHDIVSDGPDVSVFENIKERMLLEYAALGLDAQHRLKDLCRFDLSGPRTLEYITPEAVRDFMRQILEQNHVTDMVLGASI